MADTFQLPPDIGGILSDMQAAYATAIAAGQAPARALSIAFQTELNALPANFPDDMRVQLLQAYTDEYFALLGGGAIDDPIGKLVQSTADIISGSQPPVPTPTGMPTETPPEGAPPSTILNPPSTEPTGVTVSGSGTLTPVTEQPTVTIGGGTPGAPPITITGGTPSTETPGAPAGQTPQGGGGGGGGGEPTLPEPTSTGLIGDVEKYFSDLMSSIGGFFGGLVTGLTNEIGLIEDSVSAFFTSMVPTWGRALRSVVDDKYKTPLTGKIADAFSTLRYFILGVGDPPTYGGIVSPFNVNMVPTTRELIDTYVEETNVVLSEPRTIVEYFMSFVLRLATVTSAIGLSLEPILETIRQEANSKNPVEPLNLASAIDGQYKGIVTQQKAVDEALKQGISTEDYNILYKLADFTPSMNDAFTWRAQGFIDNSEYYTIAQKNHVAGTYADRLLLASIRPPSGNGAILSEGRRRAGSAGFLAGYLNGKPPQEITVLYDHNQINETQSLFDWSNHWTVPSPEWFANAHFRGLRSANDVGSAAMSNNYPDEIAHQYLDVVRPILPPRVITTMFAKGLMTEQAAGVQYAKHGFSQEDVGILIAYGKSLKKETVTGEEADLKKLSIATVVGLYEEKAITTPQLTQILMAHGYSAHAAALQANYIDLKIAAAARKAHALDLVDQVDLGLITDEQAVDALHADGFTASEVLRYQKMMHKAKAAAVRSPDKSEIRALYKEGFLTADDVLKYFKDQKYSDAWARLLTATVVGRAAGTPIVNV